MKFGDKFEEGHKAKLNEILYGEQTKSWFQ